MTTRNMIAAAFAAAIALTGALSASAQTMGMTTLSVGSNGSAVAALQAALVRGGYLMMPAGVSQGYFGSLTQTALENYQSKNGLAVTGMYDAATMSSMSAMIGQFQMSSSMPMTGSMTMNSMPMTGTMPMTMSGSMMASSSMMSGSMMMSVPTTMTKAADLRAAMHDLLIEHVTSSLSVLRAIANRNQASMAAAMTEQDNNAVALAAAIGSVYGSAAQTQFLQMFRSHITDSNAYSVAIRDGNMMNQTAALAALDQQLQSIASFLSGANPNIDDATLLAALRQHEALINQSSQDYIKGDYVGAFTVESQAIKQIAGGADYLSNAIVMQNPSLF